MGEVTGHAVANMLQELKEAGRIDNPYRLPAEEVERLLELQRQGFRRVMAEVRLLWEESSSPAEFSNRTLTKEDLKALASTTTRVSFTGCQS